MAVAPAVGEGVVLSYLVVGLLALLMWAVCLGLRGAWDHTFGVMLRLMADALNFDKYFVHIHLGGAFTAIDHRVQNALVISAQKFQHSAGYFFHGVAVIQGWIARELVGLASDTLAWATWLQHSHLPKWVKALIYTLVPPLILPRVLTALKHVKYGHWITRVRIIEKRLPVQIVRVLKATAASSIAVPLPWIRVFPRLRDLERFDVTTRARLNKIGWVGAFASVTALVAVGLRRLGLSWVRCSNVAKAGKAICKADVRWLENLLLGALAIFGTISLRTFAVEVYALMSVAAKEVAHFWRADLGHTPVNPGLGDIGNDRFLTAASGGVRANPGLGEIG